MFKQLTRWISCLLVGMLGASVSHHAPHQPHVDLPDYQDARPVGRFTAALDAASTSASTTARFVRWLGSSSVS